MEKVLIEVSHKKQTLSLSDLRGSFEEAIKCFIGWKSYYEGNCKDSEHCKLDLDYYGYDGASELNVKYYRLETDEEFNIRLEKEEKRLSKQRDTELAQLKLLKEKYED